jgi:murein DD-endopeptidase MepM/ murein hydrolase activator NlpD
VRATVLLGVLLVVALVSGIAVAGTRADAKASGATAEVAQVAPTGLASASSGELIAPPAATAGGPYAYPDDGSILRIGAANATASAQPGVSASAQSTVAALSISLFGGEISAEAISLRATAAAGARGATADASSSSVTGLVVLGAPVTATPGLQIPVAEWGTLQTLALTSETSDKDTRSAESTAIGLRLRLLAEHGGLPAGSEIVVGSVDATAVVEKVTTPPPPPTEPAPPPTTGKPAPPPPPAPHPREPGNSIPGAPPELVRASPEVTARLTQGGYVFPVYGPASFGDTFGAPRADVSGGWHHGEDIFAPYGSPLLAVADGTLFSVGWNDIGGWRLWLRDDQGNEFYYAHLSAYSSLAIDGQRVNAGDVVGFLGKTGDAERSVPHLHFEIHPVGLLSLGYDGAVAPYPFLLAWRRADDVSFAAGRQFIRDGLPLSVPRAGAVLLEVSDISAQSGLVPGALERAVGSK